MVAHIFYPYVCVVLVSIVHVDHIVMSKGHAVPKLQIAVLKEILNMDRI
jgi:hypothetical protein